MWCTICTVSEKHTCTYSLYSARKLTRQRMIKRFSKLVACGEHKAPDYWRPVFRRRSEIAAGLLHSFAPISRQLRGMATLETLNFNNKALKDLPVDPNPDNRQRQVPGACFSKVMRLWLYLLAATLILTHETLLLNSKLNQRGVLKQNPCFEGFIFISFDC